MTRSAMVRPQIIIFLWMLEVQLPNSIPQRSPRSGSLSGGAPRLHHLRRNRPFHSWPRGPRRASPTAPRAESRSNRVAATPHRARLHRILHLPLPSTRRWPLSSEPLGSALQSTARPSERLLPPPRRPLPSFQPPSPQASLSANFSPPAPQPPFADSQSSQQPADRAPPAASKPPPSTSASLR